MTMLSRFEDRYLVLQELHHRGDGMPKGIMIPSFNKDILGL